jgi:hypothetical protein
MNELDFDLADLDRAEHFPHLTQFEWDALGRMTEKAGLLTVKSLLRNADASAQRLAAQEFMAVELADARAQAQKTLTRPPRVDSLKIDTTKYSGDEKMPLRRWFCELDEALEARQIHDVDQQVRYAMSQLAGRSKSWAFGLKSSDRNCFPTLDAFKEKLQATFEPPQSEFRVRAEFLSTKQGSMDLHAYVQKMRYLASCVVGKPIDMSTQVTTFMTGLRDGPPKTQLFRAYPETLEEAFAIALGEDYNARQARGYGGRNRGSMDATGPEPMDLSVAQAQGVPGSGNGRYAKKRFNGGNCFRCLKPGHQAKDCRAPVPATDAQRRSVSHNQLTDDSPKNESDQ